MTKESIVVREVISSIHSGADVMSAMPGLVRRLLDEDAWRDFTAPNPVGHVHHERFSDFVAAEPPRGLGGRSSQLLALCGSDRDLSRRIQSLLQEEIKPAAPAIHAGPGRGNKTERTTLGLRSETAERHIRRLKRDDPELADRVVNGELSPYAAARQKGWKPPRIQVTTPERTATHLRKHMTPEALSRLVELLAEEELPG